MSALRFLDSVIGIYRREDVPIMKLIRFFKKSLYVFFRFDFVEHDSTAFLEINACVKYIIAHVEADFNINNAFHYYFSKTPHTHVCGVFDSS